MTKPKEVKNDGDNKHTFWFDKGEGMRRRCHNIDVVKELIKSGLSYQEIMRIAGKYFTSKKISEYYDIALDEINNPLKTEFFDESATDYMKRRKAEKETAK